jgi:hypothetical protein
MLQATSIWAAHLRRCDGGQPPALLSVSVGIALVAVMLAGLSFDVYAHTLIALAAENANSHRCTCGGTASTRKDANASAIEAAALRSDDDDEFRVHFWPFSPCCCTRGRSGHAVGTPVFCGMIAASIFSHSAALHYRGTPRPME